jgi:chorismate mutase/prephenate dehydratase
MSLDKLRIKVDALDKQIVRLLNSRTKVAVAIGKIKRKKGQEIYAPAREKVVLDTVAKLNAGPLPAEALQAIYREIMSASLTLEHHFKVAYLGPQATFTHEAARSRFGTSVNYVSCETITDVFSLVQKRGALYGVVPIENSTEGAVTHTLDQFVETPLKICAEIYLPISLHLMSKGERKQIKRIYSKAEVFGQCRRWLYAHMPGVDTIAVSSTARAAEMAAREPDSAAIAGQLAVDLYGLKLLARDVQDLGGNVTRFLVIGKNYGKPTGDDKTSVYFAVRHKVGALHDALTTLKQNNVNMTKIESRPSRTKAWEYYFFVDLEGHAHDPHLQKALTQMAEHCTLMTILGAYPKAKGREG